MSVAFNELRQKADTEWQGLTAGDKPWIRVGLGTSGEAAGAEEAYDALKEALGTEANVSFVGSMGLCYAEPLIDVQIPGGSRVFYNNLGADEAPGVIAAHLKSGRADPDKALAWDGTERPEGLGAIPRLTELPTVEVQTRLATKLAGDIDPREMGQYIATGGYSALDKALGDMDPASVLDEVKNSGLRGRGGAAFPTGVKWGFLAPNPAPVKYVLCNCEEGDPGAFNDKGILESCPHTLLEGLILAGYATNSSNGVIFIRQGHTLPIENSRKAVQDAYAAGLLGQNILGSDFSYDVEVALTGDSYVAGEETALMEAIEGKRSQPRYRPPFPAAAGLWGKPSNINNVKTLSYAPTIIRDGADAFKSVGIESTSGTAILCITGAVNRPGMYEVPMGSLTIREAVENVAGGIRDGKLMKMFQAGGPLFGPIGEEGFDSPIDFDSIAKTTGSLGSGGIIVGDEDVCAVNLVRNLMSFNQFESCGKCFPCRLGMTHMVETLERISQNEGREDDLELMERMGASMRMGSLCGHGQLGYNPVASALKYFEDDFNSHMHDKKCPTGACGEGQMVTPTRTRP
ncbi:MAG: NADH-quinone oxidoreductase subunit F [Chloroflexi bacterium]|nr:NADH-quinone oxidoreductase subunit F [Chloroflexota bacterium]